MAQESEQERRQAELAAREAAGIGGLAPEGEDPAQRPLREAGEGEAEGFEQAEEQLVERASHGDEQAAHSILRHRGSDEEANAGWTAGEPDHERSSEVDEDERDRE